MHTALHVLYKPGMDSNDGHDDKDDDDDCTLKCLYGLQSCCSFGISIMRKKVF